MVEGQSDLKLYYNMACTQELEKDNKGVYEYRDIVVTNNAIMPYKLNIWCKNGGSHNAYDVSIDIVTTVEIISKTSLERILPAEIKPLVIAFNIPKFDNGNKKMSLVINYDNV